MATYTTTQAPLPWMEPYLQDYMGRAQTVANQPYQQSPGTYVAPNNYLSMGWNATANRAMQGSPEMNAARGQLTNIIGGGMMQGNPYLDQSISNAQGDLVQQWNMVAKPQWDKAMQQSGSFGNTGVQQYAGMAADSLQKNLARISTDMRGNAYNTERGYMQQALGMAPAFAAQDYQDLNALNAAGMQAQQFANQQQQQNQNWWQEAQMYPQQRLDAYGRALGVGGGGTTTQQAPDPSRTSQAVGGALTGAALWNMIFGGP